MLIGQVSPPQPREQALAVTARDGDCVALALGRAEAVGDLCLGDGVDQCAHDCFLRSVSKVHERSYG
jgi:hypothetical protein